MRIAICDDFAVYREQFLYIVNEYFIDKNQNVTVTTYNDGKSLLNDIEKNGGFDIYILDVLMPELTGIELGNSLRQLGHNGQIIYLTSSEEYAIDAFRTKAFNYILKPIDKYELFSTLDEVISIMSAQDVTSIIVKTKNSEVRLPNKSIMYANMNKRIVIYHLTDGQTVESLTIRTTFAEAVKELLQDNRFVLCGASTIINLSYITIIDKDSIQFQDSSQLYVGVRACKHLRSVWRNFWNKDNESK